MIQTQSNIPLPQDPEIGILDFPYFKFLLFIWAAYLSVHLLLKYVMKMRALNKNHLAIGIGLATLGFVTGIIMGNNRNPVSDTIMSSVFALLGTAFTYFLFRKDGTEEAPEKPTRANTYAFKRNMPLLAAFLIAFPLSLLYGSHIGSKFRMQNEAFDRVVAYNQKIQQQNLDISQKSQFEAIEQERATRKDYYDKVYHTWSENEKRRYQLQLEKLKAGEPIPEVPDYAKQ